MRRRLGRPRFVIVVEAGAGLLAAPALFAQDVPDRRALRRLGRPADVETGKIAHRERPHRHAEVGQHAVDRPRRRAFENELHRLTLALGQHPVADEAVADADDHPDLADLGRERCDRRQDRFRGLGAAHDLEEPHHVRRREEVHAEHVLRPLGHRRDVVDVEIGGVRGEDRAGFGDRIEPLEHFLFYVHILEHRFDHEVGLGQRAEVERGLEPPHPLVDLLHRQSALLGGRLVVAAHDRDPAVERLLRGLHDGDGDAG